MHSVSLRSVACLTVLVCLLVMAAPAHAALYLKYGNVQGDVTAEGYQNMIQLDSFSLGVGRGISSPTGGSSDRESSAPSFSQVALTAAASSASVPMFEAAVQGQGQDATIYITKLSFGKQITYAQWDFVNAMVSSFSTGASSGGIMVDSYSLAPTSYTYTWSSYNPDGSLAGKMVYGYNLATAQSMVVSSGDTTGFSFITGVPEPASLALVLLAAPALLKRRRA